MFDTREPRQLLREIRAEMAPVVAYVSSTEKQLRDLAGLAARTDLGEAFEKLVKADFVSHQRLKSSVAAAHRLLAKIDDDLYAIENGRRRPARAAHQIGDLSFMKTAARRRPSPFEEPTRRLLH